jgi:hypothetical protein
MAIASAMAFGDMTGGDVGALVGGRIGSGKTSELGNDDDRTDMPLMASGDGREGILMATCDELETRLTRDELLLAAEAGVTVCDTDVTTC